MRRAAIILMLVAYWSGALAQHSDMRLWAGASVRYTVNKKLRLTLEEEVRLRENAGRIDKLNTEFTAGYRLGNLFEAGLLYRLIADYKPEGYFGLRHRISLIAGLEKNLSGWECSVKGSFQQTFGNINRSEGWNVPERYLRAEAEVAHEVISKKTKPFVNLEMLCRLPAGKPCFIDEYRVTAGIQFRIDKRNRIDVFYRLQQELQVADPLTGHIIGIRYRRYIR